MGLKDKTKIQFRMDQPIEENPDAHYPSDIYRGYKADVYEGAHRVPFIARWDGTVQAGSVTDQIVSLVDLYATCAEIVGAKTADNQAEDSVSILPILDGTAIGPVREAVMHHAYNGVFAVRKGKRKLIFGPSSGGWSNPGPPSKKVIKGRTFIDPDKLEENEWMQLYDLKADPSELNNLYGQYPEVVQQRTEIGQRYIDDGRSTPGVKQENELEKTLLPSWVVQYKKMNNR